MPDEKSDEPPRAAPSLLSTRHAALHATFDAVIVETLVGLLEGDVARARDRLTRLDASIRAHAGIEEERALGALEARTPPQGPGSARHIVSEHSLLARTLDEVGAALAALPTRIDARAAVEVLPLVYRLRGVVEHHTARELLLYPLLDAEPDADALARALEDASAPLCAG